MNTSFRLFPEAASHGAVEVDNLTFALLGIATVFSVGIALTIFFFIARYWHTRKVNRQSSKSEWVHLSIELVWSLGPLAILMFMMAWGAQVYVRAHQPPDNALDVYVVAKQWMWKVGHPAGRREINELHVPLGQPVRLTMISEDVVHSFFIPAFRIKQDVVPARYMTLWFEATKPGTYHLFCAEYCGTDHSRMIGRVVVQTPQEFSRWLAQGEAQPPAQGKVDSIAQGEGNPADQSEVESMAERGHKLVDAMGCMKCHGTLAGEQTAPSLEGLYGARVPLVGGKSALADDAFIRRSLLDPQTQIHEGFKQVMPSFAGQLDEEQIMDITAYIRALAQPAEFENAVELTALNAPVPSVAVASAAGVDR